jgi:hypothetical protein
VRHDRDPVRSRTGIEYGPCFQRVRIEPRQACGPSVGDEDVPFVGDDACRFRKAVQCREMAAGVMIDHLDTVPARVRQENAAALRLEGAMVEQVGRSRYLDDAHGFE